MQNQLASWLQSSQSPDQISHTVRGIVLSFSAFIILIGVSVFHVTLTSDNVAAFAADLGTLAGAIWTVYGIVMKAVMWLGRKPQG